MNDLSSTLLPANALNALRGDTTLGSANFIDRVATLTPTPGLTFLSLETPAVLPDGTRYESFSINTLMEARARIANWYLALGCVPGDVVALCVSDGIGPFLHYLAMTSIGVCAAILNPAMFPNTAAKYIGQNGFRRLVSDTAVLDRTGLAAHLAAAEVRCELIDATSSFEERHRPLPSWWPLAPEDSTLVMLSHTSGTTGTPKAVRFEHRQFFMGKRARIGQFVESADERFLLALPPSHSSAISHLETAVMLGVPTLVMSNTTGEPIRAALRSFEPTIVAAFPETYASLLAVGVAPAEFPSVRRWLSMGDAAHQAHIRRILESAPRSRFIDSFGSSELGMALFRRVSTADNVADQRCIGRPVEIAVARVLDPTGDRDMPHGEVGLLAVRSPTVTSGYWELPELTSKSWRQGYFLTGDVGFCRGGEFYLIDRAVDAVETPSAKLYTLLLEESCQQARGVCDASVIGVATRSGVGLFALVLPDREAASEPEALAIAVRDALHDAVRDAGAQVAPEAIVVAVARDRSAFPLGPTGKVLKRHLQSVYERAVAALELGSTGFEGVIAITDGKPRSARAPREFDITANEGGLLGARND